MSKKNIDMLNGPIFNNIVRYTIPIVLSGILQLLFNAADLVVVGRFCGSDSVGAVGATTSMIHLFINLFIGVSMGAGVGVAYALGSKDEELISKNVHTAIPLAFISGLIITVIGFFGSGHLLVLMETPKEFIELSILYCRIYFLGMVATMVYNFGAAILRAAGDSSSPLIFLTIAGIANVVLNFIFVAIFKMNVAGVAIATVISQFLSAILVLIALMRRTDACRLVLSKMKINLSVTAKIIKIGVPAGIQSCLFSFSNIIIQSSVNSFGNIAVAGSSAAANIEGFVYIIMNSFYQASLNFTAQNDGAHNYKRLLKVFKCCLISVFVVGLVTGVTVYLFAKPLLSIYITDSPEAIAYGTTRLSCICLPYFLCGLMEVTTGAIRGLGRSIGPMLISIVGVCGIRIVWIFTVFTDPKWHSLESLFFSYIVSWSFTFLAQLVLYIFIYKNRKQVYMVRKQA